MVYTYQSNNTLGNKLQAVDDEQNSTTKGEFIDGAELTTEYVYDLNGNMVEDKNKGITKIEYNHLNLPVKVTLGAGHINYVYDATGIKLEKQVLEASTSTKTVYAGNFIYKNDNLQFFNQPEGYIQPKNESDLSQGFDYVYQFKDHLGNIRLSYSDSDGNGDIDAASEIVEENNYYPFGLEHKGYNNVVNGTEHPYKFGGKEHNEELGLDWYDFGARNYDPALGRWMNLDPLAETMRRHSPYNYAFDNPIYFIDPDGMAPMAPLTDFYNLKGKHVKHVADGKTDKKIVLTNARRSSKVDATINKGLVINQPSENEIKQMDKAYNESESNNNNEVGYAVATDGTTSETVTDGSQNSVQLAPARKEIKDAGKEVSYTAHVHGNIITKDNGDGSFSVSSPTPSNGEGQDVDIKNGQEQLGNSTQPNVILGYDINLGSNGKPDLENSTKTLGFYTGDKTQKAVKVNFEKFKETVKKINDQ